MYRLGTHLHVHATDTQMFSSKSLGKHSPEAANKKYPTVTVLDNCLGNAGLKSQETAGC